MANAAKQIYNPHIEMSLAFGMSPPLTATLPSLSLSTRSLFLLLSHSPLAWAAIFLLQLQAMEINFQFSYHFP